MLIPPPTPEDIGRAVRVIGGGNVYGGGYILVGYVLDAPYTDARSAFSAHIRGTLNPERHSSHLAFMVDLEWDG